MSEDPYEKSKLKMYKNIYKKGNEVGASFVFFVVLKYSYPFLK